MRRLDFNPGCPGRKVLEREGIPEASIAVIAETFAQEQAACRQPHFEKALLADMEVHGIADTLVNRERATAELMRARADMLLAAPTRYPEAEGLGLADLLGQHESGHGAPPEQAASQTAGIPDVSAEDGTDEQVEACPPDDGSGLAPIDYSQSGAHDVLSPAELEKPAPTASGPIPSAAEEPEPATEQEEAAPAGSAAPSPRPSGKPLAVSEFGAKCESLIKSKRTWEKKTARDVRVVVETFAGILSEHGVTDVSEIEQFHVGRLREHFDDILARYGQSARLRQLSPRQLREASAKQAEIAIQRNQEPPQIGLGTNTIRKHLGNLAEFFRYLRGHGYALRELTMDGLRPPKLKPSDIRTLTDKPDPDRLRPLFQLPVFTGCLDAENQSLPGDQVYHSANYFVPMLLARLGARRNEITGLAARDVIETANGWAIDIRVNQFRRIKNVQSLRMLPVPDEVLRLGFVPYVAQSATSATKRCFPSFTIRLTRMITETGSMTTSDRWSRREKTSKSGTVYCTRCGTDRPIL